MSKFRRTVLIGGMIILSAVAAYTFRHFKPNIDRFIENHITASQTTDSEKSYRDKIDRRTENMLLTLSNATEKNVTTIDTICRGDGYFEKHAVVENENGKYYIKYCLRRGESGEYIDDYLGIETVLRLNREGDLIKNMERDYHKWQFNGLNRSGKFSPFFYKTNAIERNLHLPPEHRSITTHIVTLLNMRKEAQECKGKGPENISRYLTIRDLARAWVEEDLVGDKTQKYEGEDLTQLVNYFSERVLSLSPEDFEIKFSPEDFDSPDYIRLESDYFRQDFEYQAKKGDLEIRCKCYNGYEFLKLSISDGKNKLEFVYPTNTFDPSHAEHWIENSYLIINSYEFRSKRGILTRSGPTDRKPKRVDNLSPVIDSFKIAGDMANRLKAIIDPNIPDYYLHYFIERYEQQHPKL